MTHYWSFIDDCSAQVETELLTALKQDAQSRAVKTQLSSGDVVDRKWSSYGNDTEPGDDVDKEIEQGDVDVAVNKNASNNLDDNDNNVVLTTSSASFMTSVTSGDDVRRPRTTADGCEDETGSRALDLIRHVVAPASRPCDLSSNQLDAGVQEQLDSHHMRPHSRTVNSH